MYDYRELIFAVKAMRKAQKAYELKHFDDLLETKRLTEKEVDNLLREIEDEKKVEQPGLFGN